MCKVYYILFSLIGPDVVSEESSVIGYPVEIVLLELRNTFLIHTNVFTSVHSTSCILILLFSSFKCWKQSLLNVYWWHLFSQAAATAVPMHRHGQYSQSPGRIILRICLLTWHTSLHCSLRGCHSFPQKSNFT